MSELRLIVTCPRMRNTMRWSHSRNSCPSRRLRRRMSIRFTHARDRAGCWNCTDTCAKRGARCVRRSVALDNGLDLSPIQHECGGRLRPQVVWFGEALPSEVWQAAASAAARADVVLVVGTSAQVYPAAALATLNKDAFSIEINPDATPFSDQAHCVVQAKAATALPEIVRSLACSADCTKEPATKI